MMHKKTIAVINTEGAFGKRYALFLAQADYTAGKMFKALPVRMEETPDGQYHEPIVRLSEEEAQELLQSLWAVGLRPKSGEGNVGQIGAMENHLDDMRKIAFRALGMEKAGAR